MRSGSNFAKNYISISIVRGERDRGCLELLKKSDYTDYDNLDRVITYMI
jgi:hypothetical protein